MAPRFDDVDDYVRSLAPDAREALTAARAAVHAAVPGAGETISYQMPTFTVDGAPFLHVGAWRRHLGVYPAPTFGGALDDQLAPYRASKGSLQFTYRAGVPYDLIGQVAAATAERT